MNVVERNNRWVYTYCQEELERAKPNFVAGKIAYREEYCNWGCHFFLLIEPNHTEADKEEAKRILFRDRDVTGISFAFPEEKAVRTWSQRIPGDPNYTYNYARVNGITFGDMPYAPFMTDRMGSYYAEVSEVRYTKHLKQGWVAWASIRKAFANGDSNVEEWEKFKDWDEAFIWASERLLSLYEQERNK